MDRAVWTAPGRARIPVRQRLSLAYAGRAQGLRLVSDASGTRPRRPATLTRAVEPRAPAIILVSRSQDHAEPGTARVQPRFAGARILKNSNLKLVCRILKTHVTLAGPQ